MSEVITSAILTDETVHYWTINQNKASSEVYWRRATGVRVAFVDFGEFYIGRRDFDGIEDADEPFAVTHPDSGRAVCHGLDSLEDALAEASRVLTGNGLAKFQSVAALCPRYKKPDLDPSQCDEFEVPAVLEEGSNAATT